MLNKLKQYACYSIVLVFGVAFAGSGIYVWWLEVRRSASHGKSWIAVMASPHRQATVWEIAAVVAVLILATAVVASLVLTLWVFVIRLDSRESRSAQIERDGEDNHVRVCDAYEKQDEQPLKSRK
jgi:hypothetical protein